MKKIERKDFLKMTGGAVVGGLTGYVFSGAPFLMFQEMVEWSQDQYVPGKGEQKLLSSICKECKEQCQVTVRMAGDRAVKIESSNTCCPLGQSSLQLLYHPERIHKPLKLVGEKGSGKYIPVSWDEAVKAITAKINELAKAGKVDGIASVSKNMNASADLLGRLVNAAGSNQVYHESGLDTLTGAALGGVIQYDFKKSDYVLSFGAKLFEGWGSTWQMNDVLANLKKSGTKLVQVDTNNSRTTSLADEWVPVKAGTEGALALGIANYLIKKKGKTSRGVGFAKWAQLAYTFDLATTEKITGVPQKKIAAVAEAFASARNPIAVAGRGASGVSSSAAEIIAVYALNTMVGSRAVSLKKRADLGLAAKGEKAAPGLDAFIKEGELDLLFVNEADPVYKSALGADLAKKMEKAFVVAFMPLINDTAQYADYILPTVCALETLQVQGKAIVKGAPSVLHAGDAIIKIASGVDSAKAKFPWKSYKNVIGSTGAVRAAGNFNFRVNELKDQVAALAKGSSGLQMVPSELPYVGDGDGLAFPYVLKTIDIDTYGLGEMKVYLNKKTAEKQGVSDGSSIDIQSSRGEIGSVTVCITDLIAPDVIAVPLGFGHRAYTKYAKGKGVNPREIMTADIDPVTGSANWWSTHVKIS